MTPARLGLLIAIAAAPVCAQPLPEAFSRGTEFGRASNSTARSTITGGSAVSTVPHFVATPREASYFGGSGLSMPAAARLGTCAGPTTGSSFTNQACQAVDFSQSNPTRRPTFSITPSDPLLTRGQAITTDPHAIAGSIAGTYSACTAQTVTRPDIFERLLCHQYHTVEPVTCQKLRAVHVTWRNNCTPGTWFGDFWVVTWGNGEVGHRYAGVAIDAYCEVGDRIRMKLNAICTEEPCSGTAELEVDAATGATSPQTFEHFIGHSWYETDLFNRVEYSGGGCTAEHCKFDFCTRYKEEPVDCDSGRCSVKPLIRTRACGSFTFDRPRIVPEVTDTWDNQCAAFEARLP